MKVASAIIQRMLVDAGSSVGIITWDYLKKPTCLGRDIVPLTKRSKTLGGPRRQGLHHDRYPRPPRLRHIYGQRRGLLIIQATRHSDWGAKLHQLKVLTLSSYLMAILNRLDPTLQPRPPPWSGSPPAGVISLSSRPPRPLSPSSTSLSGVCTWPPLHPTFGARPEAMATCSSSATVGPTESAGPSDHDLANFSTKACLPEAWVVQKSV
ncbi:hypothetical protein Cgig2_006526 [Carnegiea gigantea]|uniref:Uncharacterized protein n=1 Tax=Carnegiea gigantea TaxID=171969 RepID=A0A9Q1GTV7_9CARY|nr:hypothetical protein Cgig2_006526 [Carnegiea gigantea]